MGHIAKKTSLKTLAACSLGVLVTVFFVSFYNEIATDLGLEQLTLTDAYALPFDAELEQARFSDEWIQVNLPFHWREKEFTTSAVWYKFNLAKADFAALEPIDKNQPWGIYLWRLNQTADVWFNGTKIGSGGSSIEPMARHWNSPLYFPIPASLIEQDNELLIKHFAQHSWGSIQAPVIGLESTLKPIYSLRYFIQHDVALSLFVFVLITGLFSFSVWFYRPSEPEYFWFAISSIGLSFYCLNQFIRTLPVDPDLWRWLLNISIDLWASALFVFMLTTLKIENQKVKNTVLAYVLVGIPVYFIASFYQIFDINIYFHIGSLLIGIASFCISFSNYIKTKESLSGFYCIVIIVIFLAGLHDTIMQATVNNGWQGNPTSSFRNHYNFVHFAAPLIFIFIGISLIKRFIDSMNAVDQLNNELENRVEIARQEIAATHRAVEDAIAQQSATEERERIYRDLHDDVGSKLLSLYYRLDKESDSTLAKSALEDLRDIVSHKTLDSCPLHKAVSQWQQEISERVSDKGINLSWEFEPNSTEIVLTELQHTHLRRMLREVLSNAILHSSDVSEIKVSIVAENRGLSISVSNDAATNPVSTWKAGRGLSNLRIRSRDLGGELSISNLNESWVKVSWNIPVGGKE